MEQMHRLSLFALMLACLMGCGESMVVGAEKRTAADPLKGLPDGGPPALYAAEQQPRAPKAWPFPEAYPRTSGFGRLQGGASFWSSFLYDDHGALGVVVGQPPVLFSPPIGTFIYPAGPAHENGADIAAAAVGLKGDSAWFRVDWQTLEDPSLPLAMWAFDTDGNDLTGSASWPAGAAVRSPGIEHWLLISGRGAWLTDALGNRVPVAAVGGETLVDLASRSFVVRLPLHALGEGVKWSVRLASGLANDAGDGFAPVPADRGSLPGQPAVYDVAFRADTQEPMGRDNWWRDKALALALANGDVTPFALGVDWDALARKAETPEPRPSGWTNRWYFSSIELGPGISPRTRFYASDFLPNYMGRRQPYGIYVPRALPAMTGAPLAILLHSINLAHNQFINWNPAFIERLCEERGSICVAPLGRGADGWWANEAELDVWEVWNRVASAYELDPTRTVLAGYSMGGYGAYRLGLEHPDLFAAVAVLAGAPACSVRIVEGVEGSAVSGNRECDQESNTSPLIENARETPFYLGHDGLDELAPVASAIEQANRFDALGQRYRIEIYSNQDHVAWSNLGTFEGAVEWLRREERRAAQDPPRITYTWYAQHQRDDLGIGPRGVWWLGELRAASDEPGFRARIDATSRAIPLGAPIVERLAEPVANSDGVGTASELLWTSRPALVTRDPFIDADFRGVAAASIDLVRAGFRRGEGGAIRLISDTPVELKLAGLKPGTSVHTSDGRDFRADGSGEVTVTLNAGETLLSIAG